MSFFQNFLNLEKDTFGLDIGQHAIKLVALKRKRRGIFLSSFSKVSIDFPVFGQDNLLNKERIVEKIQEAIENTQPAKLKTKNVVISLPENKVFLKIIKLPLLREKELKKAIIWQAKQEIPLRPEEAEVSFSVIQKTENNCEVLLVAAPTSLLNDYLEVVKKAGLELIAVEVDPIAQARALIGENEKEKTILICDIGIKNISFTLWDKGAVRVSGSTLIGEENLRASLGSQFTTQEIEAAKSLEELSKKSSQKFKKATESIFEDIKKEIEKITQFYAREEKSKVLKIILSGGGADFPLLKDYLKSQFKKTVQIANPQLAHPSLNLSPLSFKDIPVYTTAIGLALREFEDGKN